MSACCDAYLISDQRTGDEICESCGRSARYYEETNYINFDTVLQTSVEFELKKICENNHFVDSIFLKALHILRAGKEKQTLQHAAVALQEACKDLNVPRTLKEISNLFFIQPTSIAKQNKSTISLTKPSQLASRVLNGLDILSCPLIEQISSKADELFFYTLVSVSPQTALAVSIAILRPDLDLARIAKHCQVSVQTVKKHYKKVVL